MHFSGSRGVGLDEQVKMVAHEDVAEKVDSVSA